MATIVHAVIGYFFLLLTVRVLSRRPGGQLTLYEFVIVFLIGGVIILSTVGQDRSVTNCATGILTVGTLHWFISFLRSHSPRFGAILDGTPVVLIQDGVWRQEVMKRTAIAPEDIMAAARSKGVKSIFDVRYAVLERNGAISIIRTREQGKPMQEGSSAGPAPVG